MRKKRLAAAAVVVMASCALALALAGCGGSGGDIKKASEPVPASQAFSQAGVWFHSDGTPEKDEGVDSVYVFDGNGNVTVYKTPDLTYGDLDGKSDEEIIELAKQQDEETAAANNESAIARAEANIEAVEADLEDAKADFAERREALAFEYEHNPRMAEQEAQAIDEEEALLEEQSAAGIERYEEELEELKAYSYAAPEPQPFSLSIKTDGTGNNTESETLTIGDDSRELTKRDMGWTVYERYYLGYDGLYVAVEQGHRGFILDTPDTEGIEVD